MFASEHLKKIRALLERQFATAETSRFIPGKSRVPLSVQTYGADEITAIVETLLSGRVTMGDRVSQFEREFAHYVGVPYGVMVNSGSTANLVALSTLSSPLRSERIQPGDEIITPAVTWSTTVFSIAAVNAVPVLVDVSLDDMNADPEQVKRAITSRTRAILPVHVMGNPCRMDALMETAAAHGLFVIEDCCEAHGAEIGDRKVGSFGDITTFSFFFSHHITTIEGGIALMGDLHDADLARMLRAHGWIREVSNRGEIAQAHPDIDERFLFASTGYNVRPTELQAAMGTLQLPKLEGFIEARRSNAMYWSEHLEPFLDYLIVPQERPGTRHAWFGYPLVVRPGAPFTRGELMNHLERAGIECRPVLAGNIAEQPAIRSLPHQAVGDLSNARLIHRNGLFFGNHQGIGIQEREYVLDVLTTFLTASRRRNSAS